ncbi:MAG TPA: FAD-binding oxidoreductase [Acidimicrobiia bacterium]|nr:FAD-binding oxidoreductase [Acidimicrobiia bacterium]
MADLEARLLEVLAPQHVELGEAIGDDYTHDEALTATPVRPLAVVRPVSTAEVAAVVRVCDELRVPITARGAGTGLSGACTPVADGIVIALERMNEIIEIDIENYVAVVQPGVSLEQLDAALAPMGLVYPVCPGENSASLGGNVATNAGGMRAVKYGVTRNQVLGLEAVLANGDVIRTGGKFVKATTGYDLTQLVIGSEGTLAIVTEAILKIYPRPQHSATILVPFATVDEIASAVPHIVRSGVNPLVLEYVDGGGLATLASNVGLDLGIAADVQAAAQAYLIVVIEQHVESRLEEDIATLAGQVTALGAIDVYVLPPHSGALLLEAREKAFWVVKALGANDIIDVVVPRASVPEYLQAVQAIATEHGSYVSAAGHAGDGNIHLSVFQPDDEVRHRVMRAIISAGVAMGGAISAEHGIGKEKKQYFLELEDPNKIALMQRIKLAFDPNGILNPGTLFD